MERNTSVGALEGVKWSNIMQEMKELGEVLGFLAMVATPRLKENVADQVPPVCMIYAMTINHRWQELSLIQKIATIILGMGHSNKKTFERMRSLGICQSRANYLKTMDTIGDGLVQKVREFVKNNNSMEPGATFHNVDFKRPRIAEKSHVLIQMLSQKINNLPLDEPAECEELIRQLNIQISTVEDAGEKEKLLQKLKAVAFFGLEADLKRMLAKKGLRLESLNLVVKYLTNVPELAEYFHKNESDPQDEDGLENVRKRLGPDIEVLGGLSAVGIDVSQEWVKALCKRAPSLLALPLLSLSSLEDCCKGAEKGDMDEVHRLIEYAESQRSQLADISQDRRLVKEYRDSKALDQENLTKARELMTEAKAMAKHQFEQLNEILNVLELPGHWLKPKGVLPEELLKQIDYISKECSNVVESGESYKSELEVIAKASGGKALCGIYHSDYEAPQPAQIPLFLLPKDVKLNNPSTAQEVKYLKFSKKGMASEYARIVESTSTNVGIGVAGFYDTFVGEFQVGYGQDQYSQSDQTATNSKTSASVLQYIRTAKKNFRFDPYQLIISLTARIMARSIVDSASDAEVEQSARFFMKRYGSHYPGGTQSLGGVFFSIADAESNSTKDKFKLTEAAVNHLKAQISYGFLGGAFEIGTSGTSEYTTSTGQNRGRQLASSESDSFTYSVKSMGPQATNPATFHKLLSYNSTWALIDRGECQSFIPVWELFSNLGGEFKEVATVLQRTWRKDEAERKTKLEAERKEREDAKKKKDQQKAREKQLKDAREELVKIKDELLKRDRGWIKFGIWPTNGKLFFNQTSMSHSDAYEKATELIMRDPEHNICEITWLVGCGHILKCWNTSDTTPTTYRFWLGVPWLGVSHVLFFSELLFKWKDSVPLQG